MKSVFARLFFAMVGMGVCSVCMADSIPAEWRESDGNPYQESRQPRWRLDRLWPDDLKNPQSYKPLTWLDGRWSDHQRVAEAAPSAWVAGRTVFLRAGGTKLHAEYHKAPALVYIAPADGVYGVSGKATLDEKAWAPAELVLVRRTASEVSVLARFFIEPKVARDLKGVAIELKAGEELAMVVWVRQANAFLEVRLSDVCVSTDLADPDSLQRQRMVDAMPKADVVPTPTPQQLEAANLNAIKGGGIAFPAESGVRNVRAFGAVGDGVHDDTEAFRAAYRSAGLIFVPDGTYLLSGTIEPPVPTGRVPSRRVLQGQSRDRTILKLIDRAPGFSDSTQPWPVLMTSWGAAQAFRNTVRDLTIDVGSGNPGAVALDFFANNQGSVENVRLISSDPEGRGAVGLRLTGHNGPLLARNIEIVGFDLGILSAPDESVTFENVTLTNQRVLGMHAELRNFIRNLRSTNNVTTLRAVGPFTVLLNAEIDSGLQGTAPPSSTPAIEFTGRGFMSDIRVRGFSISLAANGKPINDPVIPQWSSSEPVVLGAGDPRPLGLQVLESPDVPWGPMDGWVSITKFEPKSITVELEGAKREVRDWTTALQAAIDSGAHTVYFPATGKFDILGTVHVRGNVRRIIGLEGALEPGPFRGLHKPWDLPRPRFVIEDGTAPTVVIERFDGLYGSPHIEHRSKRALVLRNIYVEQVETQPGSGPLFLDDVTLRYVTVRGSAMYARQYNQETGFQENWLPRERFATELQDGATAWLFGIKTEQPRGKIRVSGSSRAELYAYIYSNAASNPFPMFEVHDGDLSAVVHEKVLRRAPHVAVVRRVGSDGRVEDFVRPETTVPLVTSVRPTQESR